MGFEGWLVYFVLFLFWVESVRFNTWQSPPEKLRYKNLNEEENVSYKPAYVEHERPAVPDEVLPKADSPKDVRVGSLGIPFGYSFLSGERRCTYRPQYRQQTLGEVSPVGTPGLQETVPTPEQRRPVELPVKVGTEDDFGSV